MKLITKRFILRPVSKNDLDEIIININNLNVSQYLAVVPYPYNKKDALWWIKHVAKKERIKKRTDFSFIIEDKKTHKMIGAIGIHRIDSDVKKATIGYWLGEKYWGNKVMSECLEEILKFCFTKLKLNRVQADVFKENVPSAKLLEKFGFKREGLHKQAAFSKASKKIHDEYMYALLKSEYATKQKS